MKRIAALLLSLTMVLALAACGSAPASSAPAPSSAAPEGSSGAPAPSSSAPADAGNLVIYTSNSEELIDPIINEFEAQTGVKVDVITAGNGELLKKIQTEKDNPQGDVHWGGSISALSPLAEECFEPYTSANEDAIIDDYKNTDGYITRFTIITRCLLVNSNLKGDLDIQGYEDLLNPALKGKIAHCDPSASSSAFGHLTNQLYAMGNGDPDKGWDYIEKFVANLDGKLLNSSSAVWKGVADGEYTVGLTYEEVASSAKQDGAPVEIVYMKEGVFTEPDCVAVIKNAKNMDNAKKFVDFLTSKEIQTMVSSLNRRGVRGDIGAAEGLVATSDIKRISGDAAVIKASKQAWLDKFKDIFTA